MGASATPTALDADVLWTVGALFDYVSRPRPARAGAGWPTMASNGSSASAIEPQRMWRRYLLGNPVFVRRVMAQARDARRASA